MKKLITVSSVLAMLAASSAYAKTEGDYFGVELLRSKSDSQYKSNGTVLTAPGKFSDSATGYGINYKHAFNVGNDIFIAPGVFFDKIGTMAIDKAGKGEPVSINNRYGAKLDIGYDINDQFAVYFTNGFTKVRYLVDWSGANAGAKRGVTTFVYFYGIGGAYHATKNITFNIEYNTQHISLASPTEGTNARTKLDVAKIGIAYSF